MINLLIVDDETFSREGIAEMLPINDLGITNIQQAFDGVNALEIIKNFEPDILLTDVKMPRMNGIDLSFEVRKIYPNCSIIFMSGYSDKEYLKSAIELKAISYVEKPIEFDELETAIKNAVSESIKSKTIIYNLKSSLALKMTNIKYIHEIENIAKNCGQPLIESIFLESSILTVLIYVESLNLNINTEFEKICSLYDVKCLISFRDNTIIMQLFFNNHYDINALKPLFNSIGDYLCKYTKYYISVGNIFSSLTDAYNSFTESNNALSYKFFYDYNSIIFPCENNFKNYTVSSDLFDSFNTYLLEENKQELILLIKHLTLNFKDNKSTSVSYIKDTYYRITLLIIDFIKNKNIEKDTIQDNVLEDILSCSNLYILENHTVNLIENIFNALDNLHKNKLPVFSVLDYIHKNYGDPNLCLEQISKNTFLAPSYICVIFKEHTSITVNKYITEYRINKSKILLKDSNVKMSDIAEKVGYSDANYFSKIFRKLVGCTPSEYRRNFIK